MKELNFGDLVQWGENIGVVVDTAFKGKDKRRRWDYYYIVLKNPKYSWNDWQDNLIEYFCLREDKVKKYEQKQ